MPLIRRFFAPFLLAVLLVGCVGMPLQEMSDARQAVRAAERAGAQQHAPELLAEAKTLVESASQNVHNGEYREARDQAVLARDKAVEARRVAEAAKSPGGGAG
jgi:PBP1b-binding outer membrane lipoprotein LpoB